MPRSGLPAPEDVLAHLAAVRAEQAKRRLHRFLVDYAWPVLQPGTRFVDNWHIHAICEHLEAVSRGEIKRLVINLPFRMLKSTIVSQAFPVWEWITSPHLQYLTASYAKDVATRDAVDSRKIIESDAYQMAWGDVYQMTSDQNVKTRYENNKKGSRVVTATDAAGTGFGGNRIIIDDPVSATEADSAVARAASIEWWRGTASTRLNNPQEDAIIVIHQRLHVDDLTGYLLAEETGWEHLVLPMRFDPELRKTTSLGFVDPRKEAGELLNPARLDETTVIEMEARLGHYHTRAQLQQAPEVRGGALFEWQKVEIVDAIPAMRQVIRYWDKAGTKGGGAYTAGVKMGLGADGLFYILDAVRGQWAAPERESVIKTTAGLDGQSVRIWIEQEPGSGGKESAEATIRNLAGYTVKAERPTGDKETRADPLAVQVEAGNVRALRGTWNKDYFDEMKSFPTGKYKDQIDASSGAFNKLAVPASVGVLLPKRLQG